MESWLPCIFQMRGVAVSMANAAPCVPKPAPALGALGLCHIQPQNAHSGGAGGTGGVWGLGRWWGHGEHCDRLWSQLMSGFLWYPSERVFYGTMDLEQVPQGCWVIQWEGNFGDSSNSPDCSVSTWSVCRIYLWWPLWWKKISQLPNKQYSQQGEQLSAATFVPSLASRAFCCFFQLWLKETSTPGPGKMRVNYTVGWDCCTVLVLSHPCLRCLRASRVLQYYPLLILEALECKAGPLSLKWRQRGAGFFLVSAFV